MTFNPARFNAIGPDEGPRVLPSDGTTLFGKPRHVSRTAAQILRAEHGRRPLRCDEGPVRNNLAAAQEVWAWRNPARRTVSAQ